MNLELAEQHKLIVERCENLLQVILKEDKHTITEIMMKSQSIIENYNEQNLTIINPTKTELGLFSSMVKRVIEGHYANKAIKAIGITDDPRTYDYLCDKEEMQISTYEHYEYEYYDYDLFCDSCRKEHDKREILWYENIKKKNDIRDEFKNACNNTIFTDELRSRKISLSRSIIDKYYPTKLQQTLAKEIHKEVFEIFTKQNKELILKYNL